MARTIELSILSESVIRVYSLTQFENPRTICPIVIFEYGIYIYVYSFSHNIRRRRNTVVVRTWCPHWRRKWRLNIFHFGWLRSWLDNICINRFLCLYVNYKTATSRFWFQNVELYDCWRKKSWANVSFHIYLFALLLYLFFFLHFEHRTRRGTSCCWRNLTVISNVNSILMIFFPSFCAVK